MTETRLLILCLTTIQSEMNTPDCGFLWLSGTGGDGTSLQNGGGDWNVKDHDRNLCLNGATVSVGLLAFEID